MTRDQHIAPKILAVVLLVATIAEFGNRGLLLGFDFFTNPSRFWECLPIGAGIVTVLATHELGHRLLARRYQVRLSPPFFSHLQIGAGAVYRFVSGAEPQSAV